MMTLHSQCSRASSLHARAHARRGATLLEVAVASAIASIMLAMVGAWIVSLVALTRGMAEMPRAQLADTRVLGDLTRDAANARPCNPLGLSTPVQGISRTTVTFSLDATGDAIPDAVTWSVLGDTLVRQVHPGVSGCTLAEEADPAVVVATGVRAKDTAGTEWYFAPVREGALLDWSECATSGECLADAVAVDITTLTGGQPVATRFDAPVNLGWTALLP